MSSYKKYEGGFLYTRSGVMTRYSTAYGVQLAYLLNCLHLLDRDKIINFLKSEQDSTTGLFYDSCCKNRNESYSIEYNLLSLTFFSLISLDMLEEKPVFELAFLEEFKNINLLNKWLLEREKEDFWYASNLIMFVLYFFAYDQKYRNNNNNKYVTSILDYLDEKQDSQTGYWITKKTSDLEHALYGAAHIYFFYNYFNREINFKERIIDNTIKFQNQYGLFGDKYGGACEDYNGIEVLTSLSKKTNYKRDLVTQTLKNSYKAIAKNRNRDGGFSYYIDNRDFLRRLKKKYFTKRSVFYEESCNTMKSDPFYQSDMWSTYFRSLALAKIEHFQEYLIQRDYRFYDLPGWGH